MADIFISYAREDREWVEKLSKQLVAEGFSVWWDWDLLVGKRYRETIETELQTAKAAIVVWSQHSIRSDFVRDEAEDAQQRNILLPLLKEIVRPPAGFRQLQTADLSNWNGGGEHIEFRRMLKGVSSLVGRPAAGDTGAPIPVDPAHPTTHFTPEAAPPDPVTPPVDSPPVVEAKAPEPVVTPEPAPPEPMPVAAPMPSTPAAMGSPPPASMSDPAMNAGKPANSMIGLIVIGAVVLIAVVLVVWQFVFSDSKPVVPKPTTPVTHVPPPPAGMRPTTGVTPPPPPPATGDTGGGDDTGSGDTGSGGDTSGGDEGQAGPHHGGTPPATTPPPSGTDDSGDNGSDVGQGRPH